MMFWNAPIIHEPRQALVTGFGNNAHLTLRPRDTEFISVDSPREFFCTPELNPQSPWPFDGDKPDRESFLPPPGCSRNPLQSKPPAWPLRAKPRTARDAR